MRAQDLYALDESDKAGSPVKIEERDARKLNDRGYGIFWTVNEFGEYRRKSHLKQIRAWHVDIDKGDKHTQFERIKASPIYPSRIIESRNGFHVYFNSDEASTEDYKDIALGLCQHFNGDPRAAIVTALLRAPGFYHHKEEPFMVREIYTRDVAYESRHMKYFFPYKDEKEEKAQNNNEFIFEAGGEFLTPSFERSKESLPTPESLPNSQDLTSLLDSINNKKALERLSGTHWVNHEVYIFNPVSGGKYNILVNGKSTSCFIDKDNRIGARPGSPTVWQWLKYYGHDDSTIYRIIMELIDGRI